tara:strand:- start:558 stop:1019 length:462 start_codon:yes stop_codon:yes gene_type:complete
VKKLLLFILILSSNIFSSSAKDIDVQFDMNETFNCKLQKQMIKNKDYNYQTFLPDEIDTKDIEILKIISNIPNDLSVKGLSKLLNNQKNYTVKIVNKDVILFKAFSYDENYSESAILSKTNNELVHEITKNLKSKDFEKEITFYNCSSTKLDT